MPPASSSSDSGFSIKRFTPNFISSARLGERNESVLGVKMRSVNNHPVRRRINKLGVNRTCSLLKMKKTFYTCQASGGLSLPHTQQTLGRFPTPIAAAAATIIIIFYHRQGTHSHRAEGAWWKKPRDDIHFAKC
jgi:hypothetical protein